MSRSTKDSPVALPGPISPTSTPDPWHKSAPTGVRQAFRAGENGDGWAAWVKHLEARDQPKPVAALLSAKDSPLLWCLPEEVAQRDTRALIARTSKLARQGNPRDPSVETELLAWLEAAETGCRQSGYAWEALAWAHALPRLASVVSDDAWWRLVGHLVATVDEAAKLSPEDAPLVQQLLAGELPLTLAYVLPELKPTRKLAPAAARALSVGLVELLDGNGLPRAEHLGLLRPLLACWTRSAALSEKVKKAGRTKAAQTQYEWAVRGALRMTRYDGAHVFSPDSSGAWCEELFKTALRFGPDADDRAIAAIIAPRTGRGKKQSNRNRLWALPEAATHSEWAATAVLRPDWARSAPRAIVTYPGRSVHMELGRGRDVLWSGLWDFEVRRQGRIMEATSDWEEICWFSDDDVDYLELEITLREGLRVQRQILLAREDRFLFLADAVLGKPGMPAELAYRGTLPLAPSIDWHAADETREGFLHGSKRRALVLPLALGEWRCDGRRAGSLGRTPRGLELCHEAEGTSLYAPWFFDLKPRRLGCPVTWRQLTVAESLEVQPDDVAAGYRVRIGEEQWLIYRSLAAPANRTVLGQNLSNEMLVGRFDVAGEVEPLLEIE